jgi:hypothetical protein
MAVTATVYEPVMRVGRKSPPLKVAIAVPEAPRTDVGLTEATRIGEVTGEGVVLANVTVPA